MRLVRVFRIAVVVLALTAIAVVARPYVHGLSFVVRAADMHGTARRIADFDTTTEREREISIPTERGPLRGRLYDPERGARRVALLVSGLHPSGIDEPRLVRLARQLSAAGVAVVTPDIPELARFEITPAITDAIEASALWLATLSGLSSDARVGMLGISFSGGLSIVAAGRPSLATHVAYVFSFGGHDDLPRVLRYLCTGTEPYPPMRIHLKEKDDTFVRPPHDYGVAVILLGVADRVVPHQQVEALKAGVRRYLWASALEGGVDRALTKTLPEPSATLLRYVVDRDVVHLGPRLLPYVGQYGGEPALSVSKSPKPAAPVFLLHGVDDNVIPPVESEYLADDLRPHTHARLLLSGLISHAEADRPVRLDDVLELASFWGELLGR
jgi:dienelactone hydrolase